MSEFGEYPRTFGKILGNIGMFEKSYQTQNVELSTYFFEKIKQDPIIKYINNKMLQKCYSSFKFLTVTLAT